MKYCILYFSIKNGVQFLIDSCPILYFVSLLSNLSNPNDDKKTRYCLTIFFPPAHPTKNGNKGNKKIKRAMQLVSEDESMVPRRISRLHWK